MVVLSATSRLDAANVARINWPYARLYCQAMTQPMSLRDRVNALQWVHRIDLGDGLTTPGQWPVSDLISRAFDAIDFSGKKVLDVGCWDGLWSFEAERRGAREVYATDLVSQRWGSDRTFLLAREALQSKVSYHPHVSAYDVTDLGITDFDIVLFAGVYYHLKDPLRALARLRTIMRTGGTLLVEGEILCGAEAYARFFYRSRLANDPSNWWVPTVPCLREWVECSYFDIINEYGDAQSPSASRRWLRSVLHRRREPTFRRHALLARAVCRVDPSYIYPDHILLPFHVDPSPSDPTATSRV